jgi:protein-disulfide isomerase
VRSPVIRGIVWFLSVVACVAGMYLSYRLTLEHLSHEGYAVREPGFFDLNEVCGKFENADCEKVDESPYAVCSFGTRPLFAFGYRPGRLNIPVALLGLFYFTAVLCWLLLVGSCTASRWWAHLILVAGTALGVGVALCFEYIIWLVLWRQSKVWCPPCVGTHILAGLLFLFGLALWPRQPRSTIPGRTGVETAPPAHRAGLIPDWPPLRNLLLAPILALLAIFAEYVELTPPAELSTGSPAAGQMTASQPENQEKAIAALASRPSNDLAKQIVDLQSKLTKTQGFEAYYKKMFEYYDKRWEYAALSWSLMPPVPIDLTDRPVRGPANAAHTMVVFSDFQCPSCKKFEEFLNSKILPIAERRGGLRVVFKYWPICKDCNAYASTNLHPAACKASLAAEAARIVGGNEAFWKMYDVLWARQDEWKQNQDFDSLAREIGLDVAAFDRARDSEEAMKRVKADIEEGANLGKDVPGIRAADKEVIKVDSTPSVFLDDKRLWRLGQDPHFWAALLASRPRPTAAAPANAGTPGMSQPSR